MTRRRLGWLKAAAAMAGIGIGLATLMSGQAWARQGILKTKDGRTLEGDINEGPGEVAITIRGIPTKVDGGAVASIEYFDNVEQRYKERLAKMPANASAKDHLDLARWLLDMKSYDLATREVDAARRVEPNSAEAAALDQTIMSQRRMDRTRPAAGTGTAPAGGTGTRPPATAGGGDKPAAGEKKLLTPDDINTIRQMEWKESDVTAPRATVPGNVRNRYVTMKAYNSAEFAALTMQQQAYKILSDPDTPPEMRKEIKLTTDPISLTDYRRAVQPLIINSCATIGCHGGNNAGKFHLINTNVEREDVAYTNFYILRKYKVQHGDKTYQMIDPQFENLSILGQFALHPDAAELDHPELKGQAYKPMAANKTSPSYVKLVTWMKNLVAGEPKYGISYELPGGGGSGAKAAPASEKGGAAAPATPTPATPAKK